MIKPKIIRAIHAAMGGFHQHSNQKKEGDVTSGPLVISGTCEEIICTLVNAKAFAATIKKGDGKSNWPPARLAKKPRASASPPKLV